MIHENKKPIVHKWKLLFDKFLNKHMYELKSYQDLILSNHLRIDYRDIDNLTKYDTLTKWVLTNMLGTKLTPGQADYVEES